MIHRFRRGAALLAGVLLLSSCSLGTHPGDNATQYGGSGLEIMTSAAKTEVSKVTWNVFEGEPQTLDPFQSEDYSPNMINSNMCETLLAQTPSSRSSRTWRRRTTTPTRCTGSTTCAATSRSGTGPR